MSEFDITDLSQPVDSFDISDARELKSILVHFIKDYAKKPKTQSDEEWLAERFATELPGIEPEEAAAHSQETVMAVREVSQNLASVHEARAMGKIAEEWFAEKAMTAAANVPVNAVVDDLYTLETALETANDLMQEVVTTQSGVIDQNLYLHGYIAEQHLVNTFNLAAKVSDSPYRAYVCVPAPGKAYGKNSFDAVIKDESGHIVHQYQLKFGKDAKHTIAYIKQGNYHNQTIVVPAEQLEEVRAAFPGKTIVSRIGGTDRVTVSSVSITKADAQEMQASVQKTDCAYALNLDWTAYDTKMLAKHIGKRAVLAGVQGAALGAGFQIISRLAAEGTVEEEEVVAVALKTGADSGIKYAATGAIKIAAERGVLKLIPKGMSTGTIANIVCVAVENVKILSRVSAGDITCREALDQIGCNTAAMIYGLKASSYGAYKGLLLLSWIPVIGPIGGGLIGGIIGYMAGSTFGESLYHAAKKVAVTAKTMVQKTWSTIKETGRKIFQKSSKRLLTN